MTEACYGCGRDLDDGDQWACLGCLGSFCGQCFAGRDVNGTPLCRGCSQPYRCELPGCGVMISQEHPAWGQDSCCEEHHQRRISEGRCDVA